MRNIDFENIEQKYDDTLISKEWKKFEQDFKDRRTKITFIFTNNHR